MRNGSNAGVRNIDSRSSAFRTPNSALVYKLDRPRFLAKLWNVRQRIDLGREHDVVVQTDADQVDAASCGAEEIGQRFTAVDFGFCLMPMVGCDQRCIGDFARARSRPLFAMSKFDRLSRRQTGCLRW